MRIFYLAATILTACMTMYAASLNFAGANSVKAVADRVRVSRRWMVPFGMLLLSGGVGLLAGFAVPVLGAAAAAGLVAYFVCAISAHVRAGDRGVAGAVFLLLLALTSLIATIGYHDHW